MAWEKDSTVLLPKWESTPATPRKKHHPNYIMASIKATAEANIRLTSDRTEGRNKLLIETLETTRDKSAKGQSCVFSHLQF